MDAGRRLRRDRIETQDRLGALREDFGGVVAATRDANTDDEHDPEGHTIAFERSQTMSLIRQVSLHLSEIDAALERLRDESYGRCEICGEPIALDRLEARPTARTCIPCATREGR